MSKGLSYLTVFFGVFIFWFFVSSLLLLLVVDSTKLLSWPVLRAGVLAERAFLQSHSMLGGS